MDLLLVGIGGIFGSISRYELGRFISSRNSSCFPAGTFIINIIGATCLGVIVSLSLRTNAYVLIGDGFLGAFTTFSTFMYESFGLIKNNHRMNAAIYMILSLILGVSGYSLGVFLVKII